MTDVMIDVTVLALLVVVAVAVVNMRNLLAAAMLTGVYSLLSAAWMVVLDAPDVAYTEAAVGAGITTVLLLATLGLTNQEEKQAATIEPVPLFVALVTGLVLMYATLDMPAFGDPMAPIHQHVAPHYLTVSPHEIGVQNMVTAVLASYRGYDTLGETTVVFTAAVGVLVLLGGRRRKLAPTAQASELQEALRAMNARSDDTRTGELARAGVEE